MKPEERNQLARILATVDEAFLVALANKGLVRRAEKDLEGVTLEIEEADDCLIVKGADWTVRMPPTGPTKAQDDTKATGITRQILSATMYLRDHWSPSGEPAVPPVVPAAPSVEQAVSPAVPAAPPEAPAVSPPVPDVPPLSRQAPDAPSDTPPVEAVGTAPPAIPGVVATPSFEEGEAIRDALLKLSMEELSKYAGKKIVGDLLALMKDAVEIEVECHVGLTLRLPQHGVEVRCLPTRATGTRLLDELLSTAPQAMHKRWIATAVIALHRKEGKQVVPVEHQLKDESEAPRSRQQVVKEAQKLLEAMIANGVSHPSGRTIEKLFTLSLSAAAVHLPRLSHLLRSLSDEVSHLLSRHASADTHKLFSTMSWTYSLAKALESGGASAPKELAGLARTQYDAAGDLELQGLGCYPWQTASGFSGLTVLFWNPDGKRFLTWSMSRPASGSFGFNVDIAYESEQIWAGVGGTPEKLSRSRFVLKNARLNPAGRLSTAKQSSIENVEAKPPSNLDFAGRVFTSWDVLRDYAASQFPVGLKTRNPLDRIVILHPKSWDDRFFDEMQQCFCWTMLDENSHALRLTVPWNRLNESAIQFLEACKPGLDKVDRIVARIDFNANGFSVEPLSFLSSGIRRGGYVLNPSFDKKLIEIEQKGLLERLRKKWFDKERTGISTRMTTDEDWDEMLFDDDASESMPHGIRKILSETEGLLLQIAESGVQRLQERTWKKFRDLAEQCSRCGLTALAESLHAMATERPSAGVVMWCEYLCKVHKQTHVQFAKLK